jgi:hypothetical protein
MPDARERVTKTGDREARLARALRENLKRRKARDRATATPIHDAVMGGAARLTEVDVLEEGNSLRRPAAERD